MFELCGLLVPVSDSLFFKRVKSSPYKLTDSGSNPYITKDVPPNRRHKLMASKKYNTRCFL